MAQRCPRLTLRKPAQNGSHFPPELPHLLCVSFGQAVHNIKERLCPSTPLAKLQGVSLRLKGRLVPFKQGVSVKAAGCVCFLSPELTHPLMVTVWIGDRIGPLCYCHCIELLQDGV